MNEYIRGVDDSKIASFLATQSSLPPSYPPRRPYGASPQSIKTSLLVVKSSFTNGNSLPDLTGGSSSYAPQSVSTGMGRRDLEQSLRTLDEQPPPRPLQCPLQFLGCHKEFNTCHERKWVEHSLTHFEKKGTRGRPSKQVEPPKHSYCCLCEEEFRAQNGYSCWVDRMSHVKLHHELGHRLGRPDFRLMEYLWQEGVIGVEDYRDLKPMQRLPTPPSSDDGEKSPVAHLAENGYDRR